MSCLDNWPDTLNGCVTSSRSRDMMVGYRFNDVSAGPPISELVSRDTPTVWDVRFEFNERQANLFSLWLRMNDLRYNPKEFKFPIKLEEGLTYQTVKFVGFPQQTGQEGNVHSYSARILCRKLVSAYDDCPEGAMYIWQNMCDNGDFDYSATCFGQAFDEAWPR